MNPRSSWQPVAVAAGAAMAVAGLGGLMTEIGPWYLSLRQPWWKPPDWAFGPAWTVIFAMTAVAGVVAWRSAPGRTRRRRLLVLFALNGCLNALWSFLYFRLHRPDWALIEVGFLWFSVLWIMGETGRYSRKACVLLVPYLLWIAFAATLNWVTVALNGPF